MTKVVQMNILKTSVCSVLETATDRKRSFWMNCSWLREVGDQSHHGCTILNFCVVGVGVSWLRQIGFLRQASLSHQSTSLSFALQRCEYLYPLLSRGVYLARSSNKRNAVCFYF